jgi:hypothetical protein
MPLWLMVTSTPNIVASRKVRNFSQLGPARHENVTGKEVLLLPLFLVQAGVSFDNSPSRRNRLPIQGKPMNRLAFAFLSLLACSALTLCANPSEPLLLPPAKLIDIRIDSSRA